MMEDPFSDLLAAIDKAQRTTKPNDSRGGSESSRGSSPPVDEDQSYEDDKDRPEYAITGSKSNGMPNGGTSLEKKPSDSGKESNYLSNDGHDSINCPGAEHKVDSCDNSLSNVEINLQAGSAATSTIDKSLSLAEQGSARVVCDNSSSPHRVTSESEEIDEHMFTIENRPDDDDEEMTEITIENNLDTSETKEIEVEEGDEEAFIIDCEGKPSDDENSAPEDCSSRGNSPDEAEYEVVETIEIINESPTQERKQDSPASLKTKSGGKQQARERESSHASSGLLVDLTGGSDVDSENEDGNLVIHEEDASDSGESNGAEKSPASPQAKTGKVTVIDMPPVQDGPGEKREDIRTDYSTSDEKGSSCEPESVPASSSKGYVLKSNMQPSKVHESLASVDDGEQESRSESHIVIEPGKQTETISMATGIEPMNLAIQSVRGNVSDFHVIENNSPVVPVVIQPQTTTPPASTSGTQGPGKKRKTKAPIDLSDAKLPKVAPRVINPVTARPGVNVRPAPESRKGRPPVRHTGAYIPAQATRPVAMPIVSSSFMPPPAPGVLSSLRVPMSVGQQPLPNRMPIQFIRPAGGLPPGSMTSILTPRMTTATQSTASQPRMYALIIPASKPNQSPGPSKTVGVNSITSHQAVTSTISPAVVPGSASSPRVALPVSTTSSGTVPVSMNTAPSLDPKVNDNWLYKSCNLIPKTVPPSPPSNLKFKFLNHYACKVCGDTFLSNQSLTNHVTRQSACLTFKCSVCTLSIVAFNKCQLHLGYKRHVSNGCKSSVLTGNCTVAPLPADLMPQVYLDKVKAKEDAEKKEMDKSSEVNDKEETAEPDTNDSPSTEPKQDENITEIKKGKLSYICPECNYTFSSKKTLAKHFVPRSIKNYTQCNKCLMLLHSGCAYSAHMRIHDKEAPFVCPECGVEVLGPRKVFLKHIKQKCVHFTRTASFPCPKCDVRFSVKSQLQSHIVNVHAEIYHKCNKCPMAYKSMPSYKEHNLKSHGGAAMPRTICKCPLCDTVYTDEKDLSTHIGQHLNDSICKGSSTFKCLGCNFIDSKKKNIITHMNRSHSNMIVIKEMCLVCGVEGTASDIQIHTFNVHKDEYPKIYKHVDSSLTFIEEDAEEDCEAEQEPEKDGEVELTKSEPSIKQEIDADDESVKPEEKPKWECGRCQKAFDCIDIYKKHMAKHRFIERKKKASQPEAQSVLKVPLIKKKEFTKQVPGAPSHKPRYPCAECSSCFFLDTDLAAHVKSEHNRSAQFPCHLCGVTYPEKFLLEKHHKSVHQGKAKEFAYLCSLCLEKSSRQGFNSRGVLIQHLHVEHKVKKGNAEIQRLIRDSSMAAKSLDMESLPSPEKEAEMSSSSVKRLKIDGDETFICAKCGFTADDRDTFIDHIERHQEVDSASLQCKECGLSFAVQMSLKRHLFMVHKVRNFKNYLSQTGIDLEKAPEEVTKTSLTAITEVTKVSPPPQSLPNGIRRSASSTVNTVKSGSVTESSNPLECNVCYKVFDNPKSLHMHLRTHGMAFIRSKRKLSTQID